MPDRPPASVDNDLRRAILDLLDQRDDTATICPSEAARAVASQRDSRQDSWRDLMPRARDVAGRLAREGLVEVTQRGEVVDVASAKGPVRIRKAR